MFRTYRELQKGEFILVGGDTAQGGEDSNVCQFLSKNRIDVPIVYEKQGVAAQMTSDILPALERIFDITGVKPVVAFERQNGGASEMERLNVLNRSDKYDVFVMPTIGQTEEGATKKLGWDTTSMTRPILTGDLKNFIDVHGVAVYDAVTIQQLFWFINGKNGKPEAMKGKHDDHVMSLGVAVQLYQHCDTVVYDGDELPKEELFYKGGFY